MSRQSGDDPGEKTRGTVDRRGTAGGCAWAAPHLPRLDPAQRSKMTIASSTGGLLDKTFHRTRAPITLPCFCT